MKTCPPSIEQNGWINRANPCVECERIRFGEVGVGNNQCSWPEAVRKRRKRQTKTRGKALVIPCASRWRLRGRAQNPLLRPKPPLPGYIQCHCPFAECGPRSRMSPRYGRKDKPARAETHRIEEGVAALYRLKPLQIPRAEGDAPPKYTRSSREENLKECSRF